jgi:hypothetical protein
LGGYFSLPPGLHCCCSMSKPLLLFGTLTAWLRSVAPILFQGGWAVFCKLRVRAAFFFSLSCSHPWLMLYASLMFTCVMSDRTNGFARKHFRCQRCHSVHVQPS